MRAALFVSILFVISLTPALAQRSSAEETIRKIIVDQAAAWNAGDGARYSTPVSEDVSFTNLFGMVMYGKAAFKTRHSDILSTFYKGTTKSHVIRKIRFVTPEVAIVDINNEIRGVKTMPAGISVPADGILRTQLMEVFVLHKGNWLIEAYHNVDSKAAAKP